MNQPLKPLGFDSTENRLYECPVCKDTVTVEKEVFFGRCKACQATIIDYLPQDHQKEFHRSGALYRLLMGGYGTGKTTMCVAEVAQHVLSVPRGRTLITAQKLQQVEDAILPELERFIAPWFLLQKKLKPTPYYKLKNGHEIIVYASNDEEKLRSLNLTMFYMEEASGIDYSVFVQLQARLRNTAAVFKDRYGRITQDLRNGIISSNPEQGWLVDNFLLYANKIYASDSVDIKAYTRLRKKPEPFYEAFLSSTRDNKYLPAGYIQSLTAGKSQYWIRKYIDCALEIKAGAVYPDFHQHIVPDFPIPPNWKRVAGFDKGFADETTLLVGAIDPKDGTIYVYLEYYVSRQPLSYHAKMIQEIVSGLTFYNNIQADPSVLHRSDRDGRSYQEYFYSLSKVHLEPANNSISMGIEKVRDYMYCGRLKFFSSLENLKTEAYNYVYPDQIKTNEEKPADGADHLMDALRYMIMALPQNPYEMNTIAAPWIDERHVDYTWIKDDDDPRDRDLGVFTLGGAI